jgi:threonine aldolase
MTGGLAETVPFQRKQLLQLASKMRFQAAQFAGLLEDRTWLKNAVHANVMARRLADGMSEIPGISVRQAVQSNAVFAAMDPRYIEPLQREWGFYVWDDREHVVRLMAAFDTTSIPFWPTSVR